MPVLLHNLTGRSVRYFQPDGRQHDKTSGTVLLELQTKLLRPGKRDGLRVPATLTVVRGGEVVTGLFSQEEALERLEEPIRQGSSGGAAFASATGGGGSGDTRGRTFVSVQLAPHFSWIHNVCVDFAQATASNAAASSQVRVGFHSLQPLQLKGARKLAFGLPEGMKLAGRQVTEEEAEACWAEDAFVPLPPLPPPPPLAHDTPLTPGGGGAPPPQKMSVNERLALSNRHDAHEEYLMYHRAFSNALRCVSAVREERAGARTVALSSPLYDAVLAALRFGLQHHEVATTEAALQATYDLARHASQHAERAAPMAPMLQALLSHLAAELLCSRLHPDVIEPAAGNALLALIVAQQAHWQGMVAGLLAAQHEPHTRDAAAAAFGALLGTNGVSASLQKPNRVRFRANLERLLQHVRSSNMVLA